MRQIIGFALTAALLGGCAVYAEPYPFQASAGIYVAPTPVVVAPVYRSPGWGHERHAGWREGWHRG